MSLDWKGSLGALWATEAARTDALLGPLGDALVTAHPVPAGAHVLDLGCGAGEMTRALEAHGVKVDGVDISPDLLKVAETRTRARLILADAQDHDFDTAYDAIYSRCGCMFFRDPARAFTNLRNALKPGGGFYAAVWGSPARNLWATLPLEAAAPYLPQGRDAPPPEGAPGPFAWSEPQFFADDLKAAGFTGITATPVMTEVALSPPSDDPVEAAVAASFAAGPLASRIRDLGPDIKSKVSAALRTAYAPHVRERAVRLSGYGLIVTAERAA